MQSQHNTFPVSQEFSSFGPSLGTLPIETWNSQRPQCLRGNSIHRISIHLPSEYLENEKEMQVGQMKRVGSQQSNERFSNIRVYCRMREPKKGQESLIKYDATMADDGQNCYTFDYIFAKSASQKEVYNKISVHHIDDFFMGRNSTIFAYGQTGSGKTYTMFGSMNDPLSYGIIPRTLQEIFKRDLTNCTINCSMLEIYNQKLMDLFNPFPSHYSAFPTEIKLKEFNDAVFLEGLQEIQVENQQQLFNLIRLGHKGRKTAVTMSNDMSSRSHAILFLYRDFQCKGQDYRTKLCFIDLAGSEKIRKNGVKGQTLEEAKKINFSLLCLGNVIHSLTNGSDHIPYRNSKLTRILKDSLSTDTSTSIITTCSLDQNDYHETVSTIKFAVRAKKIKNKRKLLYEEETTLEEEYIKLKRELEKTKKQLEHYKYKEVEEEETDIPEEMNYSMHPIRSICVATHGCSSRLKAVPLACS